MIICYLGIGSNLGNRRANIKLAIQKIRLLNSIKVIKASRIMETFPVGGPDGQQKFLNAALKIGTNLAHAILLNKLKTIEKELGRRKTVRNGPRVIDLDILLYGERLIKTKKLTIPHPHMFKRGFVIKPLSEVICD